ncbi:lipoprotein intramolecular transacylase Lit [Secundilactobacillus odoratitofui]|uniref:lipoprotein intramolecular transacylase Lit n=1 Tax=Secundilactobacillus odoratitofui TaxID=480930 RepID=UPI0034E243C0
MFRNSDWLFNPQFDPVITVLPESFFFTVFCVSLRFIRLMMLLGVWYGKRSFSQFNQ